MIIFIGTLAPIINAISYFWFTKYFSKVFVEIVFLNIDLHKVAVRTLETFRSDQNVLICFQMYFFFLLLAGYKFSLVTINNFLMNNELLRLLIFLSIASNLQILLYFVIYFIITVVESEYVHTLKTFFFNFNLKFSFSSIFCAL